MEKTLGRRSFEYLYHLEMDRGNPDGINPDYEEGLIKGIVDLAFFAEIITYEEFAQYYKEISRKYSISKRLEREMEKNQIAN